MSPLKERTLRRIEAGQNIGLRNFIIAIKGLNFNYWVLRQGSNWTVGQVYEYIVNLIDELSLCLDQLSDEKIRLVRYMQQQVLNVADLEFSEKNWEVCLFFRNIVDAFFRSDVSLCNNRDEESVNNAIRKNLKNKRKELEMSKEKMAETIDVDLDTYKRIEAGQRCSLSTFFIASNKLNMPLDTLTSSDKHMIDEKLRNVFSAAILVDVKYNI